MLAKILRYIFFTIIFLSVTEFAYASCYPQNIRLAPTCSGSNINSVQVTWDGSYCQFCLYYVYYTDSSGNQQVLANNGCTNYANSTKLITGSDIHGQIGVGPKGTCPTTAPGGSTCPNLSQISYKPLTNTCTPPPTPTSTPSPTPSGPTATSTPTVTPIPHDVAVVAVKLGSYDKSDAAIPRTPKHPQRKLTIYFYADTSYKTDPDGSSATKKATDFVSFNKPDTQNSPDIFGIYTNNAFKVGIIPAGDYYVFAKTEGSLRQSLTSDVSKFHIDPSDPTTMVFDFTTNGQSLVVGDLNNDNVIDGFDWSAFTTCYNYPNDAAKKDDCKNLSGMFDDSFVNTPIADLNDDGFVDGIDYNNFLITFRQFAGL